MAGLTLDQFWCSTPYELTLVLGGFYERLDRWRELGAWHAAHIMNCWAPKGHKVRPKQLLPQKTKTISIMSFGSLEEYQAFERREREAAGVDDG
jgi:hypothetical protein